MPTPKGFLLETQSSKNSGNFMEKTPTYIVSVIVGGVHRVFSDDGSTLPRQ